MTRVQFGWALPSSPPKGMNRNAYMEAVQRSDDEDIWHFLTQLRERKNQVFREGITERTEELIN